MAMMLDAAKRLMPSARSDVAPFMVMDVMAAAARIEAQVRVPDFGAAPFGYARILLHLSQPPIRLTASRISSAEPA